MDNIQKASESFDALAAAMEQLSKAARKATMIYLNPTYFKESGLLVMFKNQAFVSRLMKRA